MNIVKAGLVNLTTGATGVLPIADGGTNSSTALSGSSIVISDGSKLIQGAAGTSTQVLHGNASGAPTMSAVSLTADVTGILPVANGGTGSDGMLVNRLINHAFQIDQRNAGASTATSDDVYCFDRWYALTQTAAVNVSQLTNPENGYTHALRMTQNQASAQRMGLAQIIEGVNCIDMRGQNTVLVPRIRCSSSQAIRYAILEWTGTVDAVTSDVVLDWTSSTYTANAFFLAANLTVSVVGAVTPSANTWTSLTAITAAASASLNNAIVFIWTQGTAAQNVTLDFDYVQYQIGTTVGYFERRQYGQELILCKRYFQTFAAPDGTTVVTLLGQATGLAAGKIILPLEVEMLTAPTGATVSSAAHFWVATATETVTSLSALTYNSAGKKSVGMDFTVGSNVMVAGNAVNGGTQNAAAKISFTGSEL